MAGLPRPDRLKGHLQKEGRLEKEAAMHLVKAASKVFAAEPNMLDLRYPITGTFGRLAAWLRAQAASVLVYRWHFCHFFVCSIRLLNRRPSAP
jgi:hypothetical protein